ncbi:MAG: electron transport complex subunit E [Oscillospiraceae bacterium]|nr:electron transport complex subunit E [Oscillospiraceae bacterium]
MNIGKQFKEGLLLQNPVTVQLLGLCSVLAISTTLFNGIGMGLSVLVILTCSNIVISLLRKIIPSKIRIAAFIVVIASFVTIVDLLLKAYLPALSESLGVFIPLIVVNCIILGRAEAFAYKNGVLASAIDGVAQGLGYTVVLIILCVFRELFGNGTFGGGLLNGGDGIRIIPEGYPILDLILPVGGFLTCAFLIALSQWLVARMNAKKKEEVAE